MQQGSLDNLKLAKTIVGKFFQGEQDPTNIIKLEYDELVNECWIALSTYKGEYKSSRCFGAMMSAIRKWRTGRDRSCKDEILLKKVPLDMVKDVHAGQDNLGERDLWIDAFYTKSLTSSDKDLLIQWLVLGYTMNELGEQYGVTGAAISYRLKIIKQKIKENMDG